MPITQRYQAEPISYVSILNEDGEVDTELEGEQDQAGLVARYEMMVLSRRYDERRAKLQRQGRIGTFAPAAGQEAAQIGTISCVDPTDWFAPSFRESAAAMWRGLNLADDLLYIAGFEEGMEIPDGARDLPICIPIGTQYTHALGLAWAEQLQGTDRVAVTYGGDGSTSEGDFHEAINLAGVRKAPVIFVIQNNQWAISVPRENQTRSETIAQKAHAYGVPGVQCDGNDLLAVMHVMKEAVERARRGDGPTLIEAITFRRMFHTTADDPTKYRTRETEEAWEKRDPIDRLRIYLMAKGWWSEDEEAALEKSVANRIEEALAAFEERWPTLMTPDYMFANAYLEAPPYLEQQRQELLAHFAENGLPKGGH